MVLNARTGLRGLAPKLMWAVAVLIVSVVIHGWIPLKYPAMPISDFNSIVEFACAMGADGPFVKGWYWDLLSAGTSTLLSVPLRLIDADQVVVARLATATLLSAIPLIPFFMLQGVIALRWRMLIALVIAVMPAQIVFSGVVAQDNWVQLPVVLLACLAIRNAYGDWRGYPVWSAVLWCMALYVRQEMLVAALPLAMMAAWSKHTSARVRQFSLFVIVSLALMAGIAGQREVATGTFSLTSRHAGAAMLGSYVPGAGFGWVAFDDYLARKAPEIASDREKITEEASHFAIKEISERPWFHFVRRVGSILDTATGRDGSLQYWALTASPAEPSTLDKANTLATRFSPWIVNSSILLHALFISAVFVGWRTRNAALVAIAMAVALKTGIHFVFAVQARFFLVVFVLEALALGLAVERLQAWPGLRRSAFVVFAASAVLLVAAIGSLGRLKAWVDHREEVRERMEMVTFQPRLPQANINCTLNQGRGRRIDATGYAFTVTHSDPVPGEFSELHCAMSALNAGTTRLILELEDKYAPGGFPDRMFQVVVIDGQVVRRHDIAAESWAGRWSRELSIPADRSVDVRIRVEALRPDKGPGWGNAAESTVRFLPAR